MEDWKFIMCRGLPASGKSTWAKEQQMFDRNLIVVEKDVIRRELGLTGGGKSEKAVIKERNQQITEALENGFSVISSDTNFNPTHEAYFRLLCVKYNIPFEIKDFDINPAEAVKRDLNREHPVGASVIYQMYWKYVAPTKRFYVRVPGRQSAVIFDIDGTLALFGDENPYDRDFSKDELNYPVAEALWYAQECGKKIVIFSGRDSKYRQITFDWLHAHQIFPDVFCMRESGDRRPDTDIKLEFFMKQIHENYNVDAVYDDRPAVVRLWRTIGLFVFDVNQRPGVEF